MSWSMKDRVEQLQLRSPVFVSAEATLRAAAHELWREDVGAVLVERAGRPVGILSERDVVKRAAHGDDFDAVKVGEVMSAGTIAAGPYDTLQDIAYQMLQSGIRHLPVQDGSGRVVGMVSIRDLLRPLITEKSLTEQTP
jgi:CBS domain-containing protein